MVSAFSWIYTVLLCPRRCWTATSGTSIGNLFISIWWAICWCILLRTLHLLLVFLWSSFRVRGRGRFFFCRRYWMPWWWYFWMQPHNRRGYSKDWSFWAPAGRTPIYYTEFWRKWRYKDYSVQCWVGSIAIGSYRIWWIYAGMLLLWGWLGLDTLYRCCPQILRYPIPTRRSVRESACYLLRGFITSPISSGLVPSDLPLPSSLFWGRPQPIS